MKDSNRCFFVDNDEFQLLEKTRTKLIDGGNIVSDIYLFEAASVTSMKIIVTTDEKLKDWMKDDNEFHVELLDNFLADY